MSSKILIDIKHPAQLNLFKGLTHALHHAGWEVTISYLDRGKIPSIIQHEYKGFKTVKVGGSKGTKWSIVWDGNIKRAGTFLKMIRREKYNIVIAASSIPLALSARLSRTPVLQFYDDIERGKVNDINALLSDKIYFPPIINPTKKVGVFNCLKEWSYLSPASFKPDESILQQYGLHKQQYIFVREVSNKSFNYFDQQDAIISTFAHQLSDKVKVVLSLEDKSFASKYPSDWIILKEPVGDIHSLIYFSKMMLSSGDSMAREGAMLGVPSIYCGFRDMKANQLLMNEGILHHCAGREAINTVNRLIEEPFSPDNQTAVRNRLLNKWTDMTDFMLNKILRYKN